MENEEIETCLIEGYGEQEYFWNDINVCENDTWHTVVTNKKSKGAIRWAYKDGKWYYGYSISMHGGNWYGYGGGVTANKEDESFDDLKICKQKAWKELYEHVKRITDHADAVNLAEMITTFIDDEKDQLELF